MNIVVDRKDFGFWTAKPVTVYRVERYGGDEVDVVWCNHDGAEFEEVTNHVPNPYGQDLEWTQQVQICEKCGATRIENDEWQNAPEWGDR